MTASPTRIAIQQAIQSCQKGTATENGLHLFNTLGYSTNRRAPLDTTDYATFSKNYILPGQKFDAAKALTSQWQSVDRLFQLTPHEILLQSSLPHTESIDDTLPESWLFMVIGLTKNSYTRTELSTITRELNKLFTMPVMMLFQFNHSLTLSIIDRPFHQKDDQRDIEKVTLIKDINIATPNPAHIDLLFALSFDELKRRHRFNNFIEFDKAWRTTLDTKERYQQFFEKISNWFYWAATKVKFNDKRFHPAITEDNANYLISIISRLIFIYFLKEKKLIPAELFSQDKINRLLRSNDPADSTYYRAILQNLFFGILNKPLSDQRFQQLKTKTSFKDHAALEKLFANIPCISGGLFEAGDEPYTSAENNLTVPDELFFGKEKVVDLSQFFPKRKKATVQGLIHILDQYKFTLEENTSIEEEIALDPALLGNVFENLLATINPQTGGTVRKATGSYYTPGEIVDHMASASLVLYLESNIETDQQYKWTNAGLSAKLQRLFSTKYENPFTTRETERIIVFLDQLKILDPACGSGAFPMGLLNKIVFVLGKLDPDAKKWLQLILNKIPGSADRKKLKTTLEKENSNYIRKLGIIQHTIHGVDLLPFAIRITQLRFYISLIAEQQVDDRNANRGILPLPHLDVKLVCANALIPLPEKINRAWMLEKKKGFDIIIGNPPYLGQKGNNEIFKPVKESALGKFHQRRMDYFYFFFHQAINLANDAGIINFITTNYYITATYADKLRKDLKERVAVRELINFNELKLFESALGQHNLITLLSKGRKDHPVNVIDTSRTGSANAGILKKILSGRDEQSSYFVMPDQNIYEGALNYIRLSKTDNGTPGIDQLLDRVKRSGTPLAGICHITTGIQTGADKLSQSQLATYPVKGNIGDGIFVLSAKELARLQLTESDQQFLQPWYKNSDVDKWITAETSKESLICYTSKTKKKISTKLLRHFEKYKPILINRNTRSGTTVITNRLYDKFIKGTYNISYVMVAAAFKRGAYYCISYARDTAYFESPKIVVPQRSLQNRFGYNEASWYASADVYFMIQKDKKVNLKYVLALLNSTLYYSWFYHKGKRKGESLELYLTPLSETPIKIAKENVQSLFATIANYIITCKQAKLKGNLQYDAVGSFFESLNDLFVYELYFEEEIKKAGVAVISSLHRLKVLSKTVSFVQKLEIVQAEYERLTVKGSRVKKALSMMNTVRLIQTIEANK